MMHFPGMVYDESIRALVCVYRKADSHFQHLDSSIQIIYSYDYGQTWTAPELVVDDPIWDEVDPEIAKLTDGRLAVIYTRRKAVEPYQFNIGVIYSSDGGSTWTDFEQFTLNGLTDAITPSPMFESRTGVLMVPFHTKPDGGTRKSWVIRSTDRGATWDNPISIYNLGLYGGGGETALYDYASEIVAFIRGGNDEDLLRVTSSDDGLTWSSETQVTPQGQHPYRGAKPAIGILPSGTWILSGRRDNYDPTYYFSHDGGIIWTNNLYLKTSAGNMYSSFVNVGNLLFEITCNELAPDDSDIFLNVWRDKGEAQLYGQQNKNNFTDAAIVLVSDTLPVGVITSWQNDGYTSGSGVFSGSSVSVLTASESDSFNRALDFSDTYITYGTPANFNFVQSSTAWVLGLKFKHQTGDNNNVVLCGTSANPGSGSAGSGLGVLIDNRQTSHSATNRLVVTVTRGGGGEPLLEYISPNNLIPQDTWVTVLLGYNPDANNYFIIIGDSYYENFQRGSNFTTPVIDEPFYVGNNPVEDKPFVGQVQHVEIYNVGSSTDWELINQISSRINN